MARPFSADPVYVNHLNQGDPTWPELSKVVSEEIAGQDPGNVGRHIYVNGIHRMANPQDSVEHAMRPTGQDKVSNVVIKMNDSSLSVLNESPHSCIKWVIDWQSTWKECFDQDVKSTLDCESHEPRRALLSEANASSAAQNVWATVFWPILCILIQIPQKMSLLWQLGIEIKLVWHLHQQMTPVSNTMLSEQNKTWNSQKLIKAFSTIFISVFWLFCSPSKAVIMVNFMCCLLLKRPCFCSTEDSCCK